MHNDLLGSPVAGTDKFGNVIWQEHYTPYGEKILNSAANDDLGSFTGHIDDSSTGLTYMQARYYDPVVGRFLSNDPVGFLGHLGGIQGVQGFNRYAYVNNNPYKFTDPDGEVANFAFGFTVGAGIGLANQLLTGQDINVGKIALAGAAGLTGAGITAAARLVTKAAGLGKVRGAAMKGLGEINASVAGDIIQGKETTVGGTLANIAGGKAASEAGEVIGNAGGKILSKASTSRPTKGTPNSRKASRQAQRADK